MSTSVLGKRTRNNAADAEIRSTRSKRRVVLNAPNDENENPFVRAKPVEAGGDKEVEADAPAEKRRATRTVPAKHGLPETRIPSSSPATKIDTLFKVGKASVTVFEDGKKDVDDTPKTPRHRDALSKKIAITPRHRALVAAGQITPRTPKTPSSGVVTIYNQARQAFSRCSNPGRLVGRDGERNELSTFINTCLASTSAGCVYISGPPGTGKSALVQEVLQQYENAESVKISVINCMSIRNAKDLSGKLAEDLGLKEEAGFTYLQPRFIRSKGKDTEKYIVALDEVDRLVDLDLELLYNLFEWSMHTSSRLVLIGIANALDLTDRFLPRLKSRNLRPDLLPIMPYSAAQIAEVLNSKLRSLATDGGESLPLFQPAAIQFCAKKVGSQTGDLRKAFDICRRAVDLVEQETKTKDAQLSSPSKTPLMENINLSSPPTPRSPEKKTTPIYTLETAPKVTIAHIARITAQVFSNGTTQRLASLNLQQKAVLCSLSAVEKQKRANQIERSIFATPSKHGNNASAPTIKQLFEVYSQLCKRDHLLHPLTAVEFRDVVSGLETLGLIAPADGKNGVFAVPLTPSRTPSRAGRKGFGGVSCEEKRVASVVGQRELEGALEGAGGDLLRDILGGSVVL